MIKRLLIANRGEIACRIIRSAKRSGMICCAVYATPDAQAQHVLRADEAYHLPGTSAADTYLKHNEIIRIALENQIDAIHPGYGFLSENAEFSQAVCDAGMIFIGPQSELIGLMGEKDRAKAIAVEAGLPVAADHLCAIPLDKPAITQAAEQIGYPLLAKATAGGGGKGMRLIHTPDTLMESVGAASREAANSFGNPTMLLEQYINPARHIEVQIAADQHGGVIHLFTRECSIQRRHQKVIEEAPAPIKKALSEAICASACQLVRHIGYQGLGTLEFLLGPDDRYYFMEMNTRLQVEHPVTEWITQTDCVALQFDIAQGKHLPDQASIQHTGHAIEARLCAEQPLLDFMPSSGPLTYFTYPNLPNTRVDTGFVTGDYISPYYDSMIAKAIGCGDNRAGAAQSLSDLLRSIEIIGIHSNLAFLSALIKLPAFHHETCSTDFIPKHLDALTATLADYPLRAKAIAVACFLMIPSEHEAQSDDLYSPWLLTDRFRLNGVGDYPSELLLNDQVIGVSASRSPTGFELTIDGTDTAIDITLLASHAFEVDYDGTRSTHHWTQKQNCLTLCIDSRQYVVSRNTQETAETQSESAQGELSSPMPGTITQVLIKNNDRVEAGQTLICLEAMKMEHSIKTPKSGRVNRVHASLGDSTQAGQTLVAVEFD